MSALEHSERYRASEWPVCAQGLERAGLYAWLVDHTGAAELSEGLQHALASGLIYAAQTGATLWPSGTRRKSTLAGRIGRNHLGGRVARSTFRHTLTAALRGPCGLECVDPKALTPASEEKLSRWMREHLSFAIYPTDDRDGLAALEEQVVAELDPPLNIEHCSDTPLRRRLSELRQFSSARIF